jgi:hypothetical protein
MALSITRKAKTPPTPIEEGKATPVEEIKLPAVKKKIKTRKPPISGKGKIAQSIKSDIKAKIKRAMGPSDHTSWTEQKKARSEGFMKLLRENQHKSDEELLAELRPHILESKGVPPTRKVVDDKMLLAYRLKQRGLTYAQIAQQMDVSLPGVAKLYNGALDHLRIDPATISIPENVGQTLNFYEDVRSMALMAASTKGVTTNAQMNALRVALDAEKDKNAFLTLIGVYSAPVMHHFQQLIINQFAAPSSDAKNEGMSKFLGGLANALSQHSSEQALQLIAQGSAPTESDVFGKDDGVIDV